jgi:hypothetical protein
MEDLLIRAKEQGIQQQEANAIQSAQHMLEQVEDKKRQILSAGHPDKATLDAIQGAEDLWQRQLAKANADAQQRFSTFASEIDAASQAKTRDYQQITEATGKILQYGDYIRPAFGSFPDIGTVSMSPIAKVLPGADRVSLTVTSSQLGANFKFGSVVTAGLYGGEVNAATTEVTTFLQLFGRISIKAGWQTSYTPDGVVNGPTFDFQTKPPSDKQKLPSPTIPDPPKKKLPVP